MSQIADDSLASFVKESVRVCPPLVCVSAVRWTLLWTETEAAMFSRCDSSRRPGSPRRLGLRGTPTSDAQFHLPNAKSAHRHTGKNTGECRLMAARVWSRLNGHVYRFLYEEHMTVEVDGRKKNCPQWGNPTDSSSPLCFLLCSSSFPQTHCSLHLPSFCFLSSSIDLAVSLFLYLLYSFSHLILHAHRHACTHTLASEMRTSHGTAVGVSRWKGANLWLDDWVTEEWRAKAVKLSVSLHCSRRQEPTLRCKNGSQARSFHWNWLSNSNPQFKYLFWWYLWDEDDKWLKKKKSDKRFMPTSALHAYLNPRTTSDYCLTATAVCMQQPRDETNE